MRKSTLRHKAQGQSLVEYSLLIALIALAAVVGLLLLGTAVQRIYGILAGTFGGKTNATAQEQIVIEDADCWVVYPVHQTGLYVTGTTNVPLSELLGSTNTKVGGPVNAYGGLPGGFVYQPQLSAITANEALCPQAVVIQSAKGAIAVAPLKVIVVR